MHHERHAREPQAQRAASRRRAESVRKRSAQRGAAERSQRDSSSTRTQRACNMRGVAAPDAQAAPSLAGLCAYHKRLLALLTLATLIEGFDAALTMVALPGLGREFAASDVVLYDAISLLSWGAIASGLVLWLADRVGRRPALVLSLAAYGAFSLATARAPSLAAFAWLQLGGRMFMVAQLSLAYVILSEEIPPALRGRANGVLGTFAGIGAALPPLLLPVLERAQIGWRGYFAIGALPLALAPVYAFALRETALFAARGAAVARTGSALRGALGDLRAFAAGGLLGRLAAVTAMWFTLSFWSGGVLVGFFRFLGAERGWTSDMIGRLPWGTVPAGVAGYLAAGWLMDRCGRRPTAIAYFALSALATVACYQAAGALPIAAAFCAVTALGGAWTVTNTLTAELFPTRLRATAAGIAGSLLGRLGFVAGPLAAGRLAASMGDAGDAMALLALANLACVAIVWRAIPETRGAAL
ncbi:MAG: MFS transporter [Myxococcota bacterium]